MLAAEFRDVPEVLHHAQVFGVVRLHEEGLLGLGRERVLGKEDGELARMRLGVELRLHRVRDHHVALAFGDEPWNFGVFLMGRHLRLREVLIDVELVRAARILDDAHVGPVEALVRRELLELVAVRRESVLEPANLAALLVNPGLDRV